MPVDAPSDVAFAIEKLPPLDTLESLWRGPGSRDFFTSYWIGTGSRRCRLLRSTRQLPALSTLSLRQFLSLAGYCPS